jgi:hypothetical protein
MRRRAASVDRREENVKMLTSSRRMLAAVLVVGALAGCLNDNSSSGPTRLVLRMGVSDVNKAGDGLKKSSTIQLRKLIITLTSNGVGDAVIRDTILSDTGAFVSNATIDQSFSKRFEIKPLRHWTVVVKTLDARDSVVHRDSVVANNLLAGETRNVTMNLSSRFVMKLDSAIAIDTTVPGAFAPAPAQHSITFDYILAGTTPDVTLQYYGRAAGNPNDTLLFEKVIPKVKADSTYPVQVATYVGPGSGGEGGATANMIFNIGKVGKVVFNTAINDTLPNLKTR